MTGLLLLLSLGSPALASDTSTLVAIRVQTRADIHDLEMLRDSCQGWKAAYAAEDAVGMRSAEARIHSWFAAELAAIPLPESAKPTPDTLAVRAQQAIETQRLHEIGLELYDLQPKLLNGTATLAEISKQRTLIAETEVLAQKGIDRATPAP